jgi:hypothetical protein
LYLQNEQEKKENRERTKKKSVCHSQSLEEERRLSKRTQEKDPTKRAGGGDTGQT